MMVSKMFASTYHICSESLIKDGFMGRGYFALNDDAFWDPEQAGGLVDGVLARTSSG